MTTIVFCEGILASDSSAVTGESLTYITYQKKIQLSTCKRFAWGFSGPVIDPDYMEQMETLLLAQLMTARKDNKAVFSKELKNLVNGRDFVVMTSDTIYTRSKRDEEDYKFTKLIHGEFVAIGTGRILATAAFIAGKKAAEAVEFAMKHDFYTYDSKILQIKQSVLKPLPKEIV